MSDSVKSEYLITFQEFVAIVIAHLVEEKIIPIAFPAVEPLGCTIIPVTQIAGC